MYRKYYLVEVVILLLLSHGGWNGPSVTLLPCTSQSSKLIRNVIQKRILPIVARYGATLPLECPLHPRRDMFWWMQMEIEGLEEKESYTCPICGEKFKCENKFVTHWNSSHSRSLGLNEETVCLDDYCDVFRCDILRQQREMARTQEQNYPKEDFNSLLQLPHQTRQENENRKAALKKNCHRESMALLQNKCRTVIRQCTIGMVANLSSKNFQDLEDDLDQSLCSYLTCDRYWDEFDNQLHYIPTLVCFIFVLLTVMGFCLCYYGAWLLMESSTSNQSELCCNCHKPRTHSKQKKERMFKYDYDQSILDSRSIRRTPSRCTR